MIRLAILVGCVALAATRLGLLAHELVGHGGTAVALGGRLTEVRLFWFAGGWIRYDLANPAVADWIAISMGGIAVEFVAALALWLAIGRRDTLGCRVVRGCAAAIAVHAGWYLATGAWHGYGDGVVLYRVLGGWRAPLAIAAGAVTCAAAFVGAREVLGALAATLPGSRGARIAGTLVALALAGGLHAALTLGELAVRGDRAYAAIMAPERQRVVARELAQWDAEHAAAPVEARAAQRAQLEDQHRDFPFAWLLAACVIATTLAGAARARPSQPAPIAPRLVGRAAIAAAVAIALVIALDAAAGAVL